MCDRGNYPGEDGKIDAEILKRRQFLVKNALYLYFIYYTRLTKNSVGGNLQTIIPMLEQFMQHAMKMNQTTHTSFMCACFACGS